MARDELQHQDPQSSTVAFKTPRLAPERRQSLEKVLDLLVQTGVSMRQVLDDNLDRWQNAYDMRVQTKDWPWLDSSNVYVPLTPSQLDTFVSRLMQLVVPSRLFAAKGRTAEAEQNSFQVERWYNTKLLENDWTNSIYQYVHLAARDGTCVMETVWEKRIHGMNLVQDEPEIDDDGLALIDPDTNEPVTKKVVKKIRIEEFNDVAWNPVELRDFYLFPAWARSIEEAPTVGRVLYLSEAEMEAMVESGTLWKEQVKYVLDTLGGTGEELPTDSHTETYTAGGQISVSEQTHQHLMHRQQSANRKVWRFHTREFDLDGDGIYEENVLFWHEYTKTLIGFHHYQYAHGKRCFTSYCPLERPNRFYGYAVPERLSGIQLEVNGIHNHRNDQIDLLLSPPILRTAGAQPENDKKPWGPATFWTVSSPTDVQALQLPDVPPSSWNEESMLRNDAKELLGLSDQMTGQNVGGRRTRYEMQLMAASTSVRLSLSASRLQRALQQIFSQTHQLELQYAKLDNGAPPQTQMQPGMPGMEAGLPGQLPGQPGPESGSPAGQQGLGQPGMEAGVPGNLAAAQPGQPGTPPPAPRDVPMTKYVLGLDYELGINGLGSPLDRQAKRQELLFLWNLLKDDPLVASNLQRRWALDAKILDEFEVEDQQSIIGTQADAAQLQQAMQQAQAQQQQMAAAQGNGQQPHQPANRKQRRQGGGPPSQMDTLGGGKVGG